MKTIYKRTTQKDQELAEAAVPYLKKAIAETGSSSENIEITVKNSGETIEVPKKAYKLLVEILEQMEHGNSITLVPGDSDLTTQQAADIINMSRPYLVKLLEEGKIPFTLTGSHRRVKLTDIVAYKNSLKLNGKNNCSTSTGFLRTTVGKAEMMKNLHKLKEAIHISYVRNH